MGQGFYEKSNLITGGHSSISERKFARGYYDEGDKIHEKIMEAVRKEVEKCDNFG